MEDRVVRRDRERALVEAHRLHRVAALVDQAPEVHPRVRQPGVLRERLAVGLGRTLRVLVLEVDAALESEARPLAVARARLRGPLGPHRLGEAGQAVDLEGEERLTGLGLPDAARIADGDAPAVGVDLHAGEVPSLRQLARERRERAADARDRHARLEQAARRAEHDEVLEREGVAAPAARGAEDARAHDLAQRRLLHSEDSRHLGNGEVARHRASLACRGAAPRGRLLALGARRLALGSAGGGLRRVALGEAPLERLDEVDDLLARLGARRRHDLLAGDLAVDRLDERAPVLVLVAGRVEGVARELLHELLRKRHLTGLERHVLAELDLVEAAHLVGVVEAVEGHPALHRPHEHELEAPPRRVATDRDAAGLRHRLVQQPVRLVAALVRAEEVRPLEVERVDLRDRHELRDLDRLVAARFERLELLFGEDHVLPAGVLVAAHDVVPVHRLARGAAHVVLLHARLVTRVEHVEADALRLGGREDLDRDRDEAEADRGGGEGTSRHGDSSGGESGRAYHSSRAMGDLRRYREKRDPERTPEPFEGEARPRALAPGAARAFVVQQHAARRLHYDLRLEIEGVLASWAVPKGPTLDPAERRLAVRTEDHPLAYADFEGVIPAGNYGAGAMIVWDRGNYRTLEGESPAHGLEVGKLDLVLAGHKLRGRFALVRTRSGGGRDWLLLRKGPRPASGAPEIVDAEPVSVLSGLSVQELRGGVTRDAEVEDLLHELRAPRRSLSAAELRPMLAGTATAPFSREGWLFELKYDGVRVSAERRADGSVRILSRIGGDRTRIYPEVVRALAALPLREFALDGEIVALDESGRSSFELLQRRFTQTDPAAAEAVREEVPVALYAFDLLSVLGCDLRGAPLSRRKQISTRFVPRRGFVRFVDHVEGDGEALFEAARERSLEGVVAKRADSRYESGRRSKSWLKIKAPRTAALAIVGISPGRGSRASLGALLLAWRRGKALEYAGSVGSGLDARTVERLDAELRQARVEKPAFRGAPEGPRRGVVFVRPERVCEVRY